MYLLQIWKRLSKQPIRVLDHTKAIAFLNDKEYEITGMRYENGKLIGFELNENTWHDVDEHPIVHEWIIIKDKDGKEYNSHQWVGHAYYDFACSDDGYCDGWRSLHDIAAWRYDYDFKP